MSWILLLAVVSILGFALLIALARRAELKRMEQSVRARERASRLGAQATLQHPVVDLSRCLGCGKCVEVCPEERVLELVHGQAMVVNGARCVGHSLCERECPVSAITVTIANLETRKDIPVVTEGLEAVGSPGLFLAGEVTAHSLIKTAIEHGTLVGSEVARRVKSRGATPDGTFDLVIVGAGPAGLACSLEAKRHGLQFVTLDHETELGGTVAKYPRRKLVMTQPVEMPLHGRLAKTEYTKEELIELWHSIAREHELPIEGGEVFTGLEKSDDGGFVVNTKTKRYPARHVCIAIGRRGVPRKLGVPGEELPKVAYSLMDAHSYQGRRILVVGGGDSAVETAVGLAEQPGNEVTLSYRKESFFRIKSKNQHHLEECTREGRLKTLMESEVLAIHPEEVELSVRRGDRVEREAIPNDEVFVMAGGLAPFEMLERSGVSFDASQREKRAPIVEQGTGLVRALSIGFVLALAALAFALWNRDYYSLPVSERPTHPKHWLLRPGLNVGLWFGIASSLLVVVNLLYIVRRIAQKGFTFGSLKLWMTSHVATGILAFLCALLHAAMDPRDTVGGHAFIALAVLLVTGAIGRYFYAWVPRAANGRELELADVKTSLARINDEWDQGQRKFRERARGEVLALIEKRQWRSSFLRRAFALVFGERDLHRLLGRLAHDAREQGVAPAQIQETVALARRAHRSALMAAHYEDLRSLLNTWRYVHRWMAALMVLLVVIHIGCAIAYGAFTARPN